MRALTRPAPKVATGARAPRRPRLHGRRQRLAVVIAIALLAAAVGVSAAVADTDTGSDFASAVASTARSAVHLRWQFGAIVVLLAVTHYVAATVAARAAAAVPLPFGETFLVQLGASAANRLTPAGIGGSALIARYLVRRGGLEVPVAAGAVVALTVLGGLADIAVFGIVLLVGSAVGLGGGLTELVSLVRRIETVLGPLRSPWLWAVVAGLVGLAAGFGLTRYRGRVRGWARGFLQPTVVLARRPRALLLLFAGSGSTTLILALAFAATTHLVPGPQPTLSVGALVVAFMVGAAAGNAVPVPAGLGSTEAALTAILVAARVPATYAFEQVMLFRLITFWTPAAVGVFAAAAVRRRQGI